MRKLKAPAAAIALLLAVACQAYGQKRDTNHEVYKTACPSEAGLTAADALKFLDDNPPTAVNAICETWAIYVVGDNQYEAAIPRLVALLGFRRPDIQTTWGHLPGSFYPAVEALTDIGKPALPALLSEIKTETSDLLRANATRTWILIYGAREEQAKGFAALRREAMNSTDDVAKQHLNSAIEGALKRGCQKGPMGDACRQSAADGVDR